MPPTQDNRTTQLTTPLAADTLVFRSLNGFERLSAPFEYRVTALAAGGEVDLDEVLGGICTVTTFTTRADKRVFHGRCAQIGFAGYEHGGLIYELTLRPDFWFLSRNRDCRIFQDLTAVDIASQILQDKGISRFRFQLEGGFPPKRNYCVQYMESDFAFISRLLEHEGLHYFFRHDDSGHELIIADSNAAHDQIEGHDDIPFYPPTDASGRERSHLEEWSPVHSVAAPRSIKATDFNFNSPQPMKEKGQIDSAYTGDAMDMQIHPAGYEEAARGSKLAKYRLDAERAMRAYATSSGTAIGLQPGCTFTLREHPHQPQNREHLVVEARTHIEADAYAAGRGLSVAQPERIDLVTIPSDTVFRPLLTTPRPRILGTQTAIVSGRSGEEIETEELGAVKVSFHWDTYSNNDETSSCWIRVGQSWAGPSWGGLFTPRIGMEVLVEFIDGDPDRPIIIGAVYNGQNKPPYRLPGEKTKSTIKSNSYKRGGGFNELRFEDSKGEEEIYIHAQKDQKVEILNNLTTTIGNDEKRTLERGKRETEIKLSSDTLKIGTSREVTIGASDKLTVATTSDTTVGGKMTITVAASMDLTVGGVLTIKAGVINLQGGVINIQGGAVKIDGMPILIG